MTPMDVTLRSRRGVVSPSRRLSPDRSDVTTSNVPVERRLGKLESTTACRQVVPVSHSTTQSTAQTNTDRSEEPQEGLPRTGRFIPEVPFETAWTSRIWSVNPAVPHDPRR